MLYTKKLNTAGKGGGEVRCFWPPDSCALVTSVSKPPGSCVTKSYAFATFAAATISYERDDSAVLGGSLHVHDDEIGEK